MKVDYDTLDYTCGRDEEWLRRKRAIDPHHDRRVQLKAEMLALEAKHRKLLQKERAPLFAEMLTFGAEPYVDSNWDRRPEARRRYKQMRQEAGVE
jgi:hypothetical protein